MTDNNGILLRTMNGNNFVMNHGRIVNNPVVEIRNAIHVRRLESRVKKVVVLGN